MLLHVIADTLIAFAYFSLAVFLVLLASKRRDLPFSWVFAMFGAFVIAGGTMHVLAIWTIWHPDFWVDGAIELVTAIASVGAVVALVRIMPIALGLQNPSELEAVNLRLEYANAQLEATNRLLEALSIEEQATIDHLGQGIVVLDRWQRVVRHNRAAEKCLQTDAAGIASYDFAFAHDVVDRDGEPFRVERWPIRLARETTRAHYDVFGVGTGTALRWIAMTASPVRSASEAKTFARIILILTDITELRVREIEQSTYARQLRALHLIASSTTTLRDDDIDAALRVALDQLHFEYAFFGTIDHASNELTIENSVFSKDDHDIGLPVGARVSVPKMAVSRAFAQREVLTINDLDLARSHEGFKHPIGEGSYIAVPIFVEGEPYGAIGFRSRMTRTTPFSEVNVEFVRLTGDLVAAAVVRALQRERLDALAFFDALTTLPNRVLLFDRIAHAILDTQRQSGHFVVLFVDVDGFKGVNDRYGHAAGDDVLKTLARRLCDTVRQSDTVARLGGDEFVILAPRVESVATAADLALKILAVAVEPMYVFDREHRLSVSIGIGSYPADGVVTQTLIDRADEAMYEAKKAGRNCVRFATETSRRYGEEIAEIVARHPAVGSMFQA